MFMLMGWHFFKISHIGWFALWCPILYAQYKSFSVFHKCLIVTCVWLVSFIPVYTPHSCISLPPLIKLSQAGKKIIKQTTIFKNLISVKPINCR